MDVMVVGACLAHGFETPVRGGGSHQIGVLLVKLAKGGVGRLAAK
jgi:hypothetical protein